MELLSFRGAAELAGCTATSINRAVKSGGLQVHQRGKKSGLDRNEVMIWTYKREPPDAVAAAVDEFYKVWSEVVPWMMVELERLTKTGEYSHKKLYERGVFYFTHTSRNLDDQVKYAYSEGLFFQRKENENRYIQETSNMYDFVKNLENRFLFSIYHLALNMMDNTADQMAKMDWLTEKYGDPKDSENFQGIMPFIKYWGAVNLGEVIGDSMINPKT